MFLDKELLQVFVFSSDVHAQDRIVSAYPT